MEEEVVPEKDASLVPPEEAALEIGEASQAGEAALKREPAAELARLQELEEKAKEAERLYDRLLRLQAEFENYKKRVAREREEFIKFANESLLLEMLPVLDNLERALHLAHSGIGPESLLEGVELTLRLFHATLERAGVKTIECVGQTFDPHFHEALLTVPPEAGTDHDEDVVVEEIRRGYVLEGRVLRPAQVKVAKGSRKPNEP